MGVYINMKMPRNCWECNFVDRDYGDCLVDGKSHENYDNPKNCPLVPVPPHGRLGDLDKLVDRLNDLERETKEYNPPDDIHGFNNGLLCGISHVIGEVRYYTPTIIEAEEGE